MQFLPLIIYGLMLSAFTKQAIAHDAQNQQPNILVVILDDQGIDSSAQYSVSSEQPQTPMLNQLANSGIVFDNFWATPACSSSRASLLTGKYGIHNGVNQVPGRLSSQYTSLPALLKGSAKPHGYQTGYFGKWHLSGRENNFDASVYGIDYFAGNVKNIKDYWQWPLTLNGEQKDVDIYHTTAISSLAIDWINKQNDHKPWFAILAYNAPHVPFHNPPAHLHSKKLSGSQRDIRQNARAYYLAAIEAVDTELARVIANIPDAMLEQTMIFVLGDNGTPVRALPKDAKYNRNQAKNSLYQGGIHTPLMAAGFGVNQASARSSDLVNISDLYATIAQAAGVRTSEQTDSVSFYARLKTGEASARRYNFMSYQHKGQKMYAVRDNRYKLISTNGQYSLFDLQQDPYEKDDLLAAELTATQKTAYAQLKAELQRVTETPVASEAEASDAIDLTGIILDSRAHQCLHYVNQYTSTATDIHEDINYQGKLVIRYRNGKCVFTSNAIPNHDFNDGRRSFPNQVQPQNNQFEVTAKPEFTGKNTPLSLLTDNAILLNGVKVDLVAAGCYGVRDGKIGCHDMSTPWRYDPMFENSGFVVDSHNAHAQRDGTYHYHGNPNALFDPSGKTESPVIGFAADGFPIFGPFVKINGKIIEVKSSYQLKQGQRPDGWGEPGGQYDGTFVDDYAYVEGSGHLDECNGMEHDGIYGYYLTSTYPHMLGCFKGKPDVSFNKR
ncbi:sulfatase-like hydrolase/transferase [Gayadomonas joobiniege]|uniref:sulfatase-like hydrolase/transferase n=1 Tax=Gayadomonas joobiniege TaxID=1234606 RepID=UPI00036370E3|nr:sulfatase-like hydrolase/transferase [Gayadomonas joobiniege]